MTYDILIYSPIRSYSLESFGRRMPAFFAYLTTWSIAI